MSITAGQTYAPFDAAGSDALGSAVAWIGGLVTGSIAATLCVFAIAFLGVLLFTGRIPVRTGLRTVVGCFVLLGAPIIASALFGFGEQSVNDGFPSPTVAEPNARAPLPQSIYDPYAGASLRQD